LVSKTTFSEIKTIGMPYVLFYENNSPYWEKIIYKFG
jgi:predicted nucleotide-binding protein (sugar kinase/HSP70/actin superfamily)